MTTPIQLPLAGGNPLRPASELRNMLKTGVIHRARTPVGDPAWLVTGYAEVRRLLDDDRLGRAHPEPERAARTGDSALFGGPLGNFDTERADHARMRALMQPHFTPRRVRALQSRVDALTTELLDALAESGPPADLVAKLALPLPILVICELLGVPYADRDRFRGWTQDAANIRDRGVSERGIAELFGYGLELVRHKRANPADDVISRLCAMPDVSDEEAAMTAVGLLFAGHETTVVEIGNGALLLLANHEQWQALSQNPALLPNAVDELLRARTGGGSGGIPRYARVDFEFAGVQIRTGDLVLLDTHCANHDPAAFPDPDHTDITRNAAHHLTFGYGAHYCLGAPLARLELRSVFAQLIPRFPNMRLTVAPQDLTVREDTLTGGLTELPVTW
ncbi:cytochrome P450 [Nocardia arthritidis]|uniref:Cytochrome P450 n=2 Tax=Nocardia arthritidis TaxID=228602 RepID=A0A6G9YQG5_9NOCA|nr:cytochrome P450 [Nocardia arthritidis]